MQGIKSCGEGRVCRGRGSFQWDCHPPLNSCPEAEMTGTCLGRDQSREHLSHVVEVRVNKRMGCDSRGCEARMKLVESEGTDTVELMCT